MKVRTFMPLVAAALIAVLTLALGAGTGSAKTDVKAAPAPYRVALVTDIGGLDDRSFNFLGEQGSRPGEVERPVLETTDVGDERGRGCGRRLAHSSRSPCGAERERSAMGAAR